MQFILHIVYMLPKRHPHFPDRKQTQISKQMNYSVASKWQNFENVNKYEAHILTYRYQLVKGGHIMWTLCTI